MYNASLPLARQTKSSESLVWLSYEEKKILTRIKCVILEHKSYTLWFGYLMRGD
jgi:hypothetical protein